MRRTFLPILVFLLLLISPWIHYFLTKNLMLASEGLDYNDASCGMWVAQAMGTLVLSLIIFPSLEWK